MNVGGILAAKGRGSYSVPLETRLDEVVRVMNDRNIGFVVVVDAGAKLRGVVSERDVIRRLALVGAGALDASVQEVMTRDVVTCDAAADAHAVIEVMAQRGVRHLPVLEHGQLKGVLSSRDIFGYLARHASIEEIALLWTRAGQA